MGVYGVAPALLGPRGMGRVHSLIDIGLRYPLATGRPCRTREVTAQPNLGTGPSADACASQQICDSAHPKNTPSSVWEIGWTAYILIFVLPHILNAQKQ